MSEEQNKNHKEHHFLLQNNVLNKEDKPQAVSDNFIVFMLLLVVMVIMVVSGQFFTYSTANIMAAVPVIPCDNTVLGCGQNSTDKLADLDLFTKQIPSWISWLITFTAGASILSIMIGGVMYLFSFGNEEAKTRGMTTIVWSLVGLLIAMFAFAIVRVIETIKWT